VVQGFDKQVKGKGGVKLNLGGLCTRLKLTIPQRVLNILN
jgi:hypothetical protein